jgi:hypothetical protein
MKKLLTFMVLAVSFTMSACAQQPKASPAKLEEGMAGGANIKINYSQPSAKGRKIFGDLVPYGKVWRTGANEATIFETDKDIMVEGKKLPAGKYALFTIPGETSWTIIFNKTFNQWGSFRYKEDDDVLRVDVKPEKTPSFVETFTIDVDDNKLKMMWENTLVVANIKG